MSMSSILARINLQRGQLPFQQKKENASLPSLPPFMHSPLCRYWVNLTTISDSKAEYLFSSNPSGEVFTLGLPAGNWLSGGTGELNSWYSRDRFMQLQSRGGPYVPLSYNLNSIMNSVHPTHPNISIHSSYQVEARGSSTAETETGSCSWTCCSLEGAHMCHYQIRTQFNQSICFNSWYSLYYGLYYRPDHAAGPPAVKRGLIYMCHSRIWTQFTRGG